MSANSERHGDDAAPPLTKGTGREHAAATRLADADLGLAASFRGDWTRRAMGWRPQAELDLAVTRLVKRQAPGHWCMDEGDEPFTPRAYLAGTTWRILRMINQRADA